MIQEVRPTSGMPVKVDTGIIAATNKNLESLVEESKFRLDLCCRLNVVKIKVPHLRDRKDEYSVACRLFCR